ncbi:MAG: DUF4240 domain-containing protein [Actinomycetia bacterium]|nr:DUF4240 domain-containing protein [Actinomycetes bacterium]
MDRQAFWVLFDEWCRLAESPTQVPQTVFDHLLHLPERDIVAFDRHLRARLASSNNWLMWGAAHIITGASCPDGVFQNFRLWLLAHGQQTYEAINAEPDGLADLDPRYGLLEPLLFIPTRAYEQVTGGLIPFTPVPDPHLDRAWTFDDEDAMKERYPRLCALHPAY